MQEKLFTILICGFLALLSCCSNTTESEKNEVPSTENEDYFIKENGPEFTIHLDIKTHENLRILLEGYYWKEFYTLDTITYTIADVQKTFSLTTPYRNGFYRIRIDEAGAKPMYFIVNGRNSEGIKINTDLAKLYNGQGSTSPEQEVICLTSVK